MQKSINNNITFFTPTMGRTGSEIVLFNLLNKIHPEIKVTLVTYYKTTKHSLPFSASINYLYSSSSKSIWNRLFIRFQKTFIVPLKLSAYKNSIWYVNTIVLPKIVEYAKKNNIRLIMHVHESEQMFKLLSAEHISNIVKYPDLIIANSKISERLLNQYGRKDKIKICYPSIDTTKIQKNNNIKIEYRDKLNIKHGQFIWLMSGTLDKNKNPILFVDIANELIKLNPDVLFLWLANSNNEELERICNNKIVSLGLSSKIKWIFNEVNDYYNYFQCADGFVLTSISESFSLVTLEALLFQLPIVTQDCGGVSEILKQDIGKIVKQKNDAKTMAFEMLKFMKGDYTVDKELEIRRASEFDISIWSKKWNQILLDYLKGLQI